MKTCNSCKQSIDFSRFWKNPTSRDGFHWNCKECMKQLRAEYKIRRDKSPSCPKTGRPARKTPEGTRWCSGCATALPVEKFTGTERSCSSCKRQYHIKRKYGLTPQEYSAMAESQNWLCAICKSKPFKYVDHNHKTGATRGLLCPGCNSAIGNFQEDPEIFQNALDYLKRWENK